MKPPNYTYFGLAAIGVSAGGFEALQIVLPALPARFPLPVVVVQHVHEMSDLFFIELLSAQCALAVKSAADKEDVQPGWIYAAPPGYHLLIEREKTFSLSVDHPVNHARPSIDVLFESAADAYADRLIGVVLTGANNDGAAGLKAIHEKGGMTIVEDPATSAYPSMPAAAIAACPPDFVLPLGEIVGQLLRLTAPRQTTMRR